jgi:hypothetical protein
MLIFAYIFEQVGSPININFREEGKNKIRTGYEGTFALIVN